MAIKKVTSSTTKSTTTSAKAVFQLKKETPGAVQYDEVDENGKKVEQAKALCGSLYLRKSHPIIANAKSAPLVIKVTVET